MFVSWVEVGQLSVVALVRAQSLAVALAQEQLSVALLGTEQLLSRVLSVVAGAVVHLW